MLALSATDREAAIRAKEATNGGKLDQSEITVEVVARRMGDAGGRDRGGGGTWEEGPDLKELDATGADFGEEERKEDPELGAGLV